MKIRVLFYKHNHPFVNLAIQVWTGLFNWRTKPYSHCEIWVPDGKGRFGGGFIYDPSFAVAYGGTCYTSTMRGEYNGTVKRPAGEVLNHPDRWDYFEIEISDFDYKRLLIDMDSDCSVNDGYGVRMLLQFFNPFAKMRVQDARYPVCSGRVQKWLVKNIAQFIRAWCKQMLWSPRRLSRKLVKLGYKVAAL